MGKLFNFEWIVKKLKRAIAIVEDTDTASQAISSGKYVMWKGVLTKASSNIAQGATLSSSNLTAISEGGINAIADHVANVEVLTDTFPNAVGAKQLSYPTGFDASNTYVLSLMICHDSVWYSRMEAASAAVYLTDAGIFVYNNTAGWVNDTFRIMIGKK